MTCNRKPCRLINGLGARVFIPTREAPFARPTTRSENAILNRPAIQSRPLGKP